MKIMTDLLVLTILAKIAFIARLSKSKLWVPTTSGPPQGNRTLEGVHGATESKRKGEELKDTKL